MRTLSTRTPKRFSQRFRSLIRRSSVSDNEFFSRAMFQVLLIRPRGVTSARAAPLLRIDADRSSRSFAWLRAAIGWPAILSEHQKTYRPMPVGGSVLAERDYAIAV